MPTCSRLPREMNWQRQQQPGSSQYRVSTDLIFVRVVPCIL